jgi:hypothetical protein
MPHDSDAISLLLLRGSLSLFKMYETQPTGGITLSGSEIYAHLSFASSDSCVGGVSGSGRRRIMRGRCLGGSGERCRCGYCCGDGGRGEKSGVEDGNVSSCAEVALHELEMGRVVRTPS